MKKPLVRITKVAQVEFDTAAELAQDTLNDLAINDRWVGAFNKLFDEYAWNSGGGCMIVTQKLDDNTFMHVTDEVMQVLRATSQKGLEAAANADETDENVETLFLHFFEAYL